jgi:hypothetical protein
VWRYLTTSSQRFAQRPQRFFREIGAIKKICDSYFYLPFPTLTAGLPWYNGIRPEILRGYRTAGEYRMAIYGDAEIYDGSCSYPNPVF